MSERLCIFCIKLKERHEFNAEHVFPEGIGGRLKIFHVCTTCNSALGGLVDHHLTNHYFIENYRKINDIGGKTGKVPAVYTQGVLTDDPDQKVRIIRGKEGETEKVQLIYRDETNIDQDGTVNIRSIGDGNDELAHMKAVNKVLKRNNVPEMSKEEFAAKVQRETLGPELKVTFDKDIDLFEFNRALAKIAYELTWKWLGDSYVNDPLAAEIRDFIWNGQQNVHYSFIKNLNAGFTPAEANLNKAKHQAVLEIRDDEIVCSVMISDIFVGDFQMSVSPHLYQPGFSLAAVINDALTGEISEETGELE